MAGPDGERLPRRCGRYVLFERLGGGGMAEVYKARLADTVGPGRTLVVKLLPAEADPLAVARFRDEAMIALPLVHGNITAAFEYGRAEGRHYLVMEYVHGRSARQIVEGLADAGAPLPVPAALFIVREVARALRYAHGFVDDQGKRTPIVHRDVSPENILVSFAGQVKLTDFGIARGAATPDRAGAWGKPAYVAPEVLRGDPGGPPADVYGLGCVLYELLAGRPPLLGATEAETLELVLRGEAEPIASLRPDVPDEVASLIEEALQRSPEARTADAATVEITATRLLARAAPHFTEADLAQTLDELLGRPSLSEAAPPDEALMAEQLRAQLEDAGVSTTGRESAAEILALGTVQLSPAPAEMHESEPSESSSIAGQEPPRDPVARASTPPGAESRSEEGTARRDGVPLGRPEASSAGEERGRAARRWWLLIPATILVAFGLWLGLERGSRDDAERDLVAERGGGRLDGGPRSRDAGGTREAGSTIAEDEAGGAGSAVAAVGERGGSLDGAPGERGVKRDGGASGANADRPEEANAKEARHHPRRRAPAFVTFNSYPWSYVYVDGRKLSGHTPVRDVRLPAGHHRVRFSNPELGLEARRAVRLRPGEHRFVKVRLSRGASTGERSDRSASERGGGGR